MTIEKIKAVALAAIDDLDDYARMECSVEPVGSVNCLTYSINTLITLLEETKADLAHANSILIKVEKLLEGVDYSGDYAEGVRVLKNWMLDRMSGKDVAIREMAKEKQNAD